MSVEKYNKSVYYGYLIKGQLHEAVDYLKQFPEKQQLVTKYLDIFEHHHLPQIKSHLVTYKIIDVYINYYIEVFWQGKRVEDAERALKQELHLKFGKGAYDPELIEDQIKAIVEAEGFHFLGGQTQGYYGPYIWKKTKTKTYDVTIPSGKQQYSLDIMDGFIVITWILSMRLNMSMI